MLRMLMDLKQVFNYDLYEIMSSYPYGPARNPTSVQRGSVQFLSVYPGDPTTPGYPSYENSTRTDGENIERGWAWMNPASLSTREMGPGARHDTLDDQWGYWNWRILVQLGMYI